MSKDQSTVVGGIYVIRCIVDDKFYIGSAVNFVKRWKGHRILLNKGKHHSRHLQCAWDKYGEDAFVCEILEEVLNPNDLLDIEQRYLNRFEPWRREIGYNISAVAGSNLGVKMPPRTVEFRAILSAVHKGKKKSPEHCANLSAAKMGKKPSLEARANMSAAQTGRKHRPDTLVKMSAAMERRLCLPETRAILSAANKGKKKSPEHCAKLSAAWIERRRRQRAAGLEDGTLYPYVRQANQLFIARVSFRGKRFCIGMCLTQEQAHYAACYLRWGLTGLFDDALLPVGQPTDEERMQIEQKVWEKYRDSFVV
jgi:group I intron endonuclease